MKGILFKPDMHQAIREGRKSVTRRLIKASNSTVCGRMPTKVTWGGLQWNDKVFVDKGPHILHPSTSGYLHVPWVHPTEGDDGRVFRVRSRLDVGEVMYVKEAWRLDNTLKGGGIPRLGITFGEAAEWKLGNPNQGGKWRSPLFMPAWAARTFLEIVDVRPERLQEITLDEVQVEGISPYTFARGCLSSNPPEPRWKFIELWDSINPKHPWASNPWVWRYEFKRQSSTRGRDHDRK